MRLATQRASALLAAQRFFCASAMRLRVSALKRRLPVSCESGPESDSHLGGLPRRLFLPCASRCSANIASSSSSRSARSSEIILVTSIAVSIVCHISWVQVELPSQKFMRRQKAPLLTRQIPTEYGHFWTAERAQLDFRVNTPPICPSMRRLPEGRFPQETPATRRHRWRYERSCSRRRRT